MNWVDWNAVHAALNFWIFVGACLAPPLAVALICAAITGFVLWYVEKTGGV